MEPPKHKRIFWYGYTQSSDLPNEIVNWLTKITNRSNGQTHFIYNLCEDFAQLLKLEYAIKALSLSYAPSDYGEVLIILGKYNVLDRLEYIDHSCPYLRNFRNELCGVNEFKGIGALSIAIVRHERNLPY